MQPRAFDRGAQIPTAVGVRCHATAVAGSLAPDPTISRCTRFGGRYEGAIVPRFTVAGVTRAIHSPLVLSCCYMNRQLQGKSKGKIDGYGAKA